jgi:putrescine---pyruvate transaminase
MESIAATSRGPRPRMGPGRTIHRMFATITGAWPRDPDEDDVERRIRALLALQVEAGLELLTDGQLRWPDLSTAILAPRSCPTLAEAWAAASAAVPGAVVKQSVPGPLTLAGRTGRPVEEMAELAAAAVEELVAAGCAVIEVEEPAAGRSSDDAGRASFVAAHARVLAAAGGAHMTLAISGGDAVGLGSVALAAVPYQSYLFDLIGGPDSWRVIAELPGERGIVCGALRTDGRGGDPAPLLAWAARYAASLRGRGIARVGLANAGSLAGLAEAAAFDRVRALGRAARLASMAPAHAVEAGLDPRSFDARTAAYGRVTRRPRRPGPRSRVRVPVATRAPPAAPGAAGWRKIGAPAPSSQPPIPRFAVTTSYWHGFADMHVVKDAELVLVEGDGASVTDASGTRYLDATAALWYCAAGFGRKAIADAVAEQLTRLAAYSTFGPYVTDATLRLADRVAALAPIDDAVVLLTSGGSEAIDTAAKLARRYWDVVGRPEKRVIVSREHSYHGMAAFGTALAGIPLNKAGYGGELVEAVAHVGTHDLEGLERVLAEGASEIAAFIAEPVVGAGGVIPPVDGYWARVQELCERYDILLIADEVITGFGRTGEWWGSQRYGIRPDLIVFAKAVTSGYVPLGGVIAGARVRAPFWDEPVPGAIFRHGYTYSGHAGACAAGLANLDILEGENLVGRVLALEPVVEREFGRLASTPGVGEVRTVGLTAAVELSDQALAADPTAPDKAVAAARRHGVLTRVLRGRALQFSPAFVITEEEIGRIAGAFDTAIRETVRG